MRLTKPSPEQFSLGVRAMKMVATDGKPLSPAATNMLRGAERAFLGTERDLGALRPIAPAELAAAIVDPALRLQFVQGLLMLSLVDGPPSAAQMDLVDGFAKALAVEAPELRTLRLLADEHTVFFRLHFLRHSHLAEVGKRQIEESGILGPIKGFLGLRGHYENPELAARFRRLESLRDDTLGYAFTRYIHENGFTYPGEKGGFPEAGIWHDFGHVLSGYATDPEGELQMAAFQAGYRRNNAFFMLLFGALTFSAGVNVTPLDQPDTRGILAKEGLADRLFEALERGGNMSVDLFDGWDPWAHVELGLEEARAKFNLAPRHLEQSPRA